MRSMVASILLVEHLRLTILYPKGALLGPSPIHQNEFFAWLRSFTGIPTDALVDELFTTLRISEPDTRGDFELNIHGNFVNKY